MSFGEGNRYIRLAAVVSLSLGLVACASTSGGSADAGGASAAQFAEAEGELVCRNEATVGSKIARKVCYRKKDLDAVREAAQDGTADLQRQGGMVGNPTAGGD